MSLNFDWFLWIYWRNCIDVRYFRNNTCIHYKDVTSNFPSPYFSRLPSCIAWLAFLLLSSFSRKKLCHLVIFGGGFWRSSFLLSSRATLAKFFATATASPSRQNSNALENCNFRPISSFRPSDAARNDRRIPIFKLISLYIGKALIVSVSVVSSIFASIGIGLAKLCNRFRDTHAWVIWLLQTWMLVVHKTHEIFILFYHVHTYIYYSQRLSKLSWTI